MITKKDEIAGVITAALLSFRADRGMNNSWRRGDHIIECLSAAGWKIIKKENNNA